VSASGSDGLSRRLVLGGLAALPALRGLLDAGAALAQTAAPLASWNDGPAKDAILTQAALAAAVGGSELAPATNSALAAAAGAGSESAIQDLISAAEAQTSKPRRFCW